MNVVAELNEVLGGPSKVALSLVPPTTVANVDNWRRNGIVPPKWVLPVEKLAQKNGIKVTRYQIRPDIFGDAP